MIGYLSARTPRDSVEVLADFRRGLAETGFSHGGIERAWFFLLALTRPVRRKVGLNAENLRPLFSRAASLSGKHL